MTDVIKVIPDILVDLLPIDSIENLHDSYSVVDVKALIDVLQKLYENHTDAGAHEVRLLMENYSEHFDFGNVKLQVVRKETKKEKDSRISKERKKAEREKERLLKKLEYIKEDQVRIAEKLRWLEEESKPVLADDE